MNNITINQNFNGIFYKIIDKEKKNRGYLIAAVHAALFEGTIQPKAFSDHVKKRFAKTLSLIVEVNPLKQPQKIKERFDEQRKANFVMDYELMIEASKENKEIKELETVDFHISICTELVAANQKKQIKILEEISAQVMASEKYEKCELLNEKRMQLQEYIKKNDEICKEISSLKFSESEEKEKQIKEKTIQEKEYRNKINELTNEIVKLHADEEVIRCTTKIQNIYKENNKEYIEFMKGIYETSDESKMDWAIKFDTPPEMFKEFWEDRNVGMADKIDDILLKAPGRHFIAVGKGHLVGQMGIAALLREKGWIVERINRDSLIFKDKEDEVIGECYF